MKTICMPSLGADMAKGAVAHWQVKPGDKVKKGDIIATIETMKGLIDMEVFDDGVIESLLVAEGEEIAVGDAIAQLRLKGEQSTAVAPTTSPAKVEDIALAVTPNPQSHGQIDTDEAESEPVLTQKHVAIEQDVNVKISPAAKHLANQLGIQWQHLGSGQGPGGALILADIEALQATALPAMATIQTAQQTQLKISDSQNARQQMRAAIAAVVSHSKQHIPHYYLESDICLERLKHHLSICNETLTADKRILPNAFIFCAIARALTHFQEFNGFYQQTGFQPSTSIHLGNAINLRQGGLVVAAIHDAQQLAPAGMMAKLKDQVCRAREGGLRMSEMQDATITVSNLGDRGCDRIQSIIFPPQVAIIGIGRERSVPWVIDGQVTIASVVSVSLAADHRVSDGHMGARFLNKISTLLQQPESLC